MMDYETNSKKLSEQQLTEEKNKVVDFIKEASNTTQQEGRRWRVLTDDERRLLFRPHPDLVLIQDRDYRDNYLTNVYHQLGTIAVYAKILDVSVFVYFGKYSVVLNGMGDRDEQHPKTMTLYVIPNQTGNIQHMYGVLARNDSEEQRAERILSANSQIWEEQLLYNENPDDGQYQRREYKVTTDKTQGLNDAVYVDSGDSEYERLANIVIGMYQAKTVTEVTNTMRKEMGQPKLRREVVDSSINLQRHDPGEFGQAKTIYSLTNELRQQVGQEKLVSSVSKADLDMYNLMLH